MQLCILVFLVRSHTSQLYRVLVARHMTCGDLARKCGLDVRTIWNIACGNNCSRKGRAKVEAALGVTLWPREAGAGKGGGFQSETEIVIPNENPSATK